MKIFIMLAATMLIGFSTVASAQKDSLSNQEITDRLEGKIDGEYVYLQTYGQINNIPGNDLVNINGTEYYKIKMVVKSSKIHQDVYGFWIKSFIDFNILKEKDYMTPWGDVVNKKGECLGKWCQGPAGNWFSFSYDLFFKPD